MFIASRDTVFILILVNTVESSDDANHGTVQNIYGSCGMFFFSIFYSDTKSHIPVLTLAFYSLEVTILLKSYYGH